jgi:hypothetical protein
MALQQRPAHAINGGDIRRPLLKFTQRLAMAAAKRYRREETPIARQRRDHF